MQFTDTGAHALAQGIKCLVYGRAGTGKTRLIATAPAPLILSSERGTLSIAAEKIPMILISNNADLTEAYNFIVGDARARSFQTICLDGVTDIAETILAELRAKLKDPRAAYGEMKDTMEGWIRKFRDLPGRNVYFTAKEEVRSVEGCAALHRGMMPGNKSAEGLAYYFDEVFRMEVRSLVNAQSQVVRYSCLVTQPDVNIEAKERSGVLSPVEEPHLGKIFEKIRTRYALQPVSPQ